MWIVCLKVYAMEGLPTAAINRLTRLRVLRVIGCKVDTLTSSVFEGLHMLKELYLQASYWVLPFLYLFSLSVLIIVKRKSKYNSSYAFEVSFY